MICHYDGSTRRDCPSSNNCLETGPNTLLQIIDILLPFRLNKIALISDIKQAFLNVLMLESETEREREREREREIFYDFYE